MRAPTSFSFTHTLGSLVQLVLSTLTHTHQAVQFNQFYPRKFYFYNLSISVKYIFFSQLEPVNPVPVLRSSSSSSFKILFHRTSSFRPDVYRFAMFYVLFYFYQTQLVLGNFVRISLFRPMSNLCFILGLERFICEHGQEHFLLRRLPVSRIKIRTHKFYLQASQTTSSAIHRTQVQKGES